MLGKTAGTTLPIGRFEPSDDNTGAPLEDPSFTQAIQRAEDGLAEMGYQGVDGEPDITIVLRHTRGRLGPDKMVIGTIYAGPIDPQQVVNDLNRQI